MLLGLSGPLLLAPDDGAGSGGSSDAGAPEASGDDAGSETSAGDEGSDAGGSDAGGSGGGDAEALLFGEDDSLDSVIGELYGESEDDGEGFDPFADDDPLGLGLATDTEAGTDNDSGDADGQGQDGDLSDGEVDGAEDGTEGESDGDETSDGSPEAGTDGDGDGAEGDGEASGDGASGVTLEAQLGDAIRQRLQEVAPGAEVSTVEDLVSDYGAYREANESMIQAQNVFAGVLELDPGLTTVVESAAKALQQGEDVDVLALLAEHVPGLTLAEEDPYGDPDTAARTAAAKATLDTTRRFHEQQEKQRVDYIERWKGDADADLKTFIEQVGEERATQAAATLRRFTQGDSTGGVFRMPKALEMLTTLDKGARYDQDLAAAKKAEYQRGLKEGRQQKGAERKRRKSGASPRLSGGGGRSTSTGSDPLGLDENPSGRPLSEIF